MFFPKAMSEVELIVPAKDLLSVTRILGGRGIFHQVESSFGGIGAGEEGVDWHERASAYAALERRVQALIQNLGLETEGTSAAALDELIDVRATEGLLDKIELETKQASDDQAATRKHLDQLRAHKAQLETVTDLELNVGSMRDPRFVFSMLGVMPASNVARLRTSLSRVPHTLITLREDAHRPVVWIAGTLSNRDIMERAARSAYFETLALPLHYDGTPRQIVESLRKEIGEAEQRLKSIQKDLQKLAQKYATQLRGLAWEGHASRTIADAVLRFGRLRHAYVIVGWIASEDVAGLVKRVKDASKETVIEVSAAGRAGDRKNVPVKLQSSPLLKPFQMLVTTYGRPSYGEVDPTLLIALTFPLLFGAMFGDVGHGLLLAAFGILLSSRKVAKLRGLASLGGLLTVCGMAAVLFGFLYGSLFGFENILHAAWLQPGEDPLTILTFAIVAGIIILSIGYLIGIYNGAVSRNWGHFLFGHAGMVRALLYWCLLAYVASTLGMLPVPSTPLLILVIVLALLVMFSGVLMRLVEGERPLVEGGVGTYAIQAPIELLEAFIGYLSNSLSYVRIGAFAIAHVVLSSVIFILAELLSPGHGLAYWIVVVIGNIGIVVYEGLIVGIQAMRLSYYELFSKFFSGGGVRFEPLTLAPKAEA